MSNIIKTVLLISLLTLFLSSTTRAESQQAYSIVPILTYLLSYEEPIVEEIPPYDRDEWGYWQTADGINTRGRVLIRDGLIDGNTGDRYWICPYTGLRFDNATDIDIDHVVSLYDAHYSGGYRWSYEKRLEFYNDMDGLGLGYEEKFIKVFNFKSSFKAVTYYATNLDNTLNPFTWYKQHVLIGAQEANLPKAYIDLIEIIPAIEDFDKEREAEQLAFYSQ